MKQHITLIIVLFAFFYGNSLSAIAFEIGDTSEPLIRKSSLVVLPLAFYTPETRIGGGAATLFAFRFRNQSDSTRPSQVQLGFAYTQEKQLLSYFPYQIFLDNAKYNIYGEIGYYRYFFYFFGLGNNTTTESERFTVQFPRVRINALKTIYPNVYAGVRYWFDDYRIVGVEEGGTLATQNITGNTGGVVSSLGLVGNYDTRDNIFFPTKGALVELAVMNNSRTLGSDFDFRRVSLDASTYFTNKWNHTFAVNGWFNFIFGDAPFNELAMIGGTKKMRGYYEGRFRDKKLWMLQAEYRMPELYWRLGLVAFASVGSVAPDFKSFVDSKVHYSVGTGLRVLLSDKEKVHIRIDVGIDEQQNILPYVTVTEAF